MDCWGSDLHQSYGIKNYAGLDSKDKTFYRFQWFRFQNTAQKSYKKKLQNTVSSTATVARPLYTRKTLNMCG